MKIRLAYPDKLVVVEGDKVLVFDGKLVEGELSEVMAYAEGSQAILPEELKKVAMDIKRAIEAMRIPIEVRSREIGVEAY
ncbi:hypothetical protein A3L04_04530 [Thermococcus chitonophagus]|uniref:Uncharacterized protein n=1 Tax=Thermococcus chitonophagus TaxID=54262 RepID=A0A160VTX3_9EURY|nr:hypothetical protein [Thermococcus chitonophagus]ASJ16391.1 hypothetical protein A3L04_04530 [Thermococcus chitonophagus]CUX78617.1 hypothetical protein CHITON_1838 [Thermococcus chitonophagus]